MQLSVHDMAYLRREKEIVEVDFTLSTVWEAINKAVTSLEWKIEQADEATHQVKVKTKSNFMAYASDLTINAIAQNEKTTRVTVSAETPVTTITGIVDFGRTRERIDSFLLALIKQLKPEGTAVKKQEAP
jgi:hypothetical protein